jgi:hypothetical protein
MREWLFVFLYGALFLVGAFLAPFWFSLAAKRARRVARRWTLRSDRYFVLALAIGTIALGDTLVFAGRTYGNLVYGLSAILLDGWDAVVIGTGLAIVLLGKGMLVWLADLEKEPAVWTWTRWLTGATIAWAVSAALIELAYGLN